MDLIHENVYANLINGIVRMHNEHKEKKIIWCGENKWLYRVIRALATCGIELDVVLDNSPMKKCIVTEYYRIENFDNARKYREASVYAICSLHAQEMLEQLVEVGVRKQDVFLFKPIEYEIERFVKGFYYDTYKWHKLSLCELQNKLFETLCFFKEICEKNNLRYFLYDGTLIGAVRHKGFIPWDDDIDVVMPYEDYLKLSEVFVDNGKYTLLSSERDSNYEYALPRIVSNDTRVIIPEYTIFGGFIDVFLIGGYPSRHRDIEIKWDNYKKAEEDWDIYNILKDTCFEPEDSRGVLYKNLFDIKFDDADWCGVMRTERQARWVAPKEWFSKTVELDFCGQRFSAPAGYDSYLKMKYGDYMKIPDVERRESHMLEVYSID